MPVSNGATKCYLRKRSGDLSFWSVQKFFTTYATLLFGVSAKRVSRDMYFSRPRPSCVSCNFVVASPLHTHPPFFPVNGQSFEKTHTTRFLGHKVKFCFAKHLTLRWHISSSTLMNLILSILAFSTLWASDWVGMGSAVPLVLCHWTLKESTVARSKIQFARTIVFISHRLFAIMLVKRTFGKGYNTRKSKRNTFKFREVYECFWM